MREARDVAANANPEQTMADEKLTLEAVKKLAADIGMTRLNDTHLQDLLRATNAAHARRKALDMSGLTYADEPAHILDLTRGDTQ